MEMGAIMTIKLKINQKHCWLHGNGSRLGIIKDITDDKVLIEGVSTGKQYWMSKKRFMKNINKIHKVAYGCISTKESGF